MCQIKQQKHNNIIFGTEQQYITLSGLITKNHGTRIRKKHLTQKEVR